jgi:hypothetical protein
MIKVPRTLASGVRSVDTIYIQLSTGIETTDAEKQQMLVTAAKSLTDSETSDFWKGQSLG